jgi:hypothetical protein
MTMQDDDLKWGKLAYDAYAAAAGGRSLVTGDDLPPWINLSDQLKTCWITAARTVVFQAEADARARDR